MLTIKEIDAIVNERMNKMMQNAEESYETEFNYAISEIRHAHADMVCFGIENAMLWDNSVLSAIKSAKAAEENYKRAVEIFNW